MTTHTTSSTTSPSSVSWMQQVRQTAPLFLGGTAACYLAKRIFNWGGFSGIALTGAAAYVLHQAFTESAMPADAEEPLSPGSFDKEVNLLSSDVVRYLDADPKSLERAQKRYNQLVNFSRTLDEKPRGAIEKLLVLESILQRQAVSLENLNERLVFLKMYAQGHREHTPFLDAEYRRIFNFIKNREELTSAHREDMELIRGWLSTPAPRQTTLARQVNVLSRSGTQQAAASAALATTVMSAALRGPLNASSSSASGLSARERAGSSTARVSPTPQQAQTNSSAHNATHPGNRRVSPVNTDTAAGSSSSGASAADAPASVTTRHVQISTQPAAVVILTPISSPRPDAGGASGGSTAAAQTETASSGTQAVPASDRPGVVLIVSPRPDADGASGGSTAAAQTETASSGTQAVPASDRPATVVIVTPRPSADGASSGSTAAAQTETAPSATQAVPASDRPEAAVIASSTPAADDASRGSPATQTEAASAGPSPALRPSEPGAPASLPPRSSSSVPPSPAVPTVHQSMVPPSVSALPPPAPTRRPPPPRPALRVVVPAAGRVAPPAARPAPVPAAASGSTTPSLQADLAANANVPGLPSIIASTPASTPSSAPAGGQQVRRASSAARLTQAPLRSPAATPVAPAAAQPAQTQQAAPPVEANPASGAILQSPRPAEAASATPEAAPATLPAAQAPASTASLAVPPPPSQVGAPAVYPAPRAPSPGAGKKART